MRNGDKTIGALQASPASRQMVSDVARRSGADVKNKLPIAGAMSQQGQDWSNGTTCFPQKFIRLIGYRDPNCGPASRLGTRPAPPLAKPVLSDTPIG